MIPSSCPRGPMLLRVEERLSSMPVVRRTCLTVGVVVAMPVARRAPMSLACLLLMAALKKGARANAAALKGTVA